MRPWKPWALPSILETVVQISTAQGPEAQGGQREACRQAAHDGRSDCRRIDLAGDGAAQAYWTATQDYWADVREAWDAIMLADSFTTEDDAEGTLMYGPVLSQGQAVFFEAKTTEAAFAEAAQIIETRVTADGAPVEVR